MLTNDQLDKWDRESFFHPSTHLAQHARGESPNRIVTGGKGVFIEDRDGNKLLDAFAGLYCVNVGYGRTEISEAIAEQAKELAYYHAYVGHGTEASITLAKMILDASGGALLPRSAPSISSPAPAVGTPPPIAPKTFTRSRDPNGSADRRPRSSQPFLRRPRYRADERWQRHPSRDRRDSPRGQGARPHPVPSKKSNRGGRNVARPLIAQPHKKFTIDR